MTGLAGVNIDINNKGLNQTNQTCFKEDIAKNICQHFSFERK